MSLPKIVIRPELPAEFAEIHAFVKTAFETAKVSNGEEQDYVDRWRASQGYLPDLALVAIEDDRIVGHVMLTRTSIATADGPREVLLLAPLSVALSHRCQGLGARLVEAVHARAAAAGHTGVVLVGDPAYYGRFGYRRSADVGIDNVDGIPAEYVLAHALVPGGLDGLAGRIDFF